MSLRKLEKAALYAFGTRKRVIAYLTWARGPRQTGAIVRVCRLAPGSISYTLNTLRGEGQIRRIKRGEWQATGASRDLLFGLHQALGESPGA